MLHCQLGEDGNYLSFFSGRVAPGQRQPLRRSKPAVTMTGGLSLRRGDDGAHGVSHARRRMQGHQRCFLGDKRVTDRRGDHRRVLQAST